MKVAIVTYAPFPLGLAATNRVYYYAKGLIDQGIETKVYIVTSTEINDNVRNFDLKGIFNSIPFEYTSLKTVRDKGLFKRKYDDIAGSIKAGWRIKNEKFNYLFLISSNASYHIMYFKYFCKLTGIKYFMERTELPFHNKKNHGIYKYLNQFQGIYLYKHIRGFFAISRYLVEVYSGMVSKNAKVLLVPVIVDVNEIYRPEVERTKNFVYTGPLIQKKDGILTIIESFTQIAKEFKDYNLVLTGNIEKTPEKYNIMKLIDNNPFKDRIIFKGFVAREEMVDLLNSAIGLLLAKPSGEQADSCFPTKLGEYLATGNPVIVTSTGEIPFYLKDGIDAYIAKPDSVESFAEKMREIINNPKKAWEVGMNGQKTAIDKFNYLATSKKITEFVQSLK